MTAEEQFHAEIIRVCCEAICAGYTKTYLRNQARRVGGLAVAKRLIWAKAPSSAFNILRQADRTDLTVESVILSRDWGDLFTPRELETARVWLSRPL